MVKDYPHNINSCNPDSPLNSDMYQCHQVIVIVLQFHPAMLSYSPPEQFYQSPNFVWIVDCTDIGY